ncbi:hypothetical protein Forpe1208_v015686 [Fusarium oxysporum f. sp. rapae]|uniref:Uncharacterized protein n=1 Tax=Fusarium oxysporum f. sp. rapae TaxID=485398 RepID=A0A8J5NFU4_FUSOX|nr:hypothetical protein Forpe1208_v015686 [Fusarium oxysporum f. sp. rapae]
MHKLLFHVKLSVTAKESLDEFDTSILAKASLAPLSNLKHGCFTDFEKGPELLGKAVTGLDELLNTVTVGGTVNVAHCFLCLLHFIGKLDKEELHITGHIRNRSARAMTIRGPVINPLPEIVGIKDAA